MGKRYEYISNIGHSDDGGCNHFCKGLAKLLGRILCTKLGDSEGGVAPGLAWVLVNDPRATAGRLLIVGAKLTPKGPYP
jgi:hypothetical protein